MDSQKLAAFADAWPLSWPIYRQVLEGLFSDYGHENLFKRKQALLLLEQIVPRKANDRADLLLRFSFDDIGITWDIFQKGWEIVHAQPIF